MSDLYRGYDAGLLDASTADRAQGRQARDDFFRGVKFSPFDLLGAPVDLVNMGLQGIDTMFGRRNVLGSERPLLGADDLINRYADFVEYMGYDYGRPTNSPGEIAGRITGGILAPTGGAAAFGRGVDLLEAGGRAYAAGAPARVAERARTTTLGSGIDPTAPIDDMIVARQGGVARSEDVFSEVADFPSLSKSEEQLVAASSAPPEEVAGLGRVVTEPIDPENMAASRARFNELQEMTSGYEQERAKARIVKLDDGTDAIQYMEPPATVQTVSIGDLKATQPGILTGGDAALTEGPPLVVKKGGELFVRDGHHRLARMIEAGADTADVRVVDLDAGGLLGVETASDAAVESMPLFQQIGKRPMSRAMPPAEQALYEAGAAMQLPRESGEGLLLPQRAYDLGAAQARVIDEGLAIDPGFQNIAAPFIPAEQTGTIFRDLGTVADSPVISLQDLIGDTAKLMPGDMTMAGQEITHVMGVKLQNPVRMQGGKDFPAEELSRELGLVWASDPAVISGYAKQARDNPGLLGIYSAMGARSGDFSHHVADVVVDMTKQADWIPKSEIKRFDDEVRKFKVTTERADGTKVTTQPFDDFPGILSDEVESYLYSPGKGTARKAIADIMEKSSYRKKGFPDLSVIRTVVASPEMRYRVNDPSAMMAPTGGRIVRFDADPMTPMGGEGNIPVFHKTYRQGISGEDLGGLEMPVPRSLIFPEFFASRRAADRAMSSDRRSAEISNVLQTITPEIADDVDRFQEMYRRGLLGDVF